MRCRACNDPLSNKESTRKSVLTGEYIDLCDHCFDTIKEDIPTVDNPLSETEFKETEDKTPNEEKELDLS